MENIDNANRLLGRTPDEGYRDEWAAILRREKERAPEETLSLLVFRLHSEWFAIATTAVEGIYELSAVHSIPHSKSPLLNGVVNIKGRLQLCIALDALLEIEGGDDEVGADVFVCDAGIIHSRLVGIEHAGDKWYFPVDEVVGVMQVVPDQLGNVPATVQKSDVNFLKGLFNYHGDTIAYLDTDLVFAALSRAVL
jgi:chemotaxis-related protein WspD